MREKAARNAEVVRHYMEQFRTMEDIGSSFGVSRERVRQILRANGVTRQDDLRVRDVRKRLGSGCDVQGYRRIYAPECSRANSDGYVPEHAAVMERVLGRALRDEEHVHHINGDRSDNRPENLRVMDAGEHMRIHKQKWTREALLDVLRWLALRLGRTPCQSDMNDGPIPCYHMHFVNYFGGIAAAQEAAGLTPNTRGGDPYGPRGNPLTPMFRKRFGHLARFASAETLLESLHAGLPTHHERETAMETAEAA